MSYALLASHDPLDHVLPHRFGEPLFHWNVNWTSPLDIVSVGPHDTYFTNHILMTIVAAVLMLLIFPWLGRRYTAVQNRDPAAAIPRGFASLVETMMQYVRNDIARPILAERTDRFIPFLWTLFFYILICNLLGMIPLDSIVYLVSGLRLRHIGGTPTSNIMITGGLAFVAFAATHVSGMRRIFQDLVAGTYGHHGHGDEHHGAAAHGHHDPPHGDAAVVAVVKAPVLYIWNFAPHVFTPPPDAGGVVVLLLTVADFAMWLVLLALEFIGAIIKPFALAIRLFANMVAGHVVLGSLLALIFAFQGSIAMNYGLGVISSLGCAALSLLELFVAFLQAYVFTFLTTLFIGAAVAPEH